MDINVSCFDTKFHSIDILVCNSVIVLGEKQFGHVFCSLALEPLRLEVEVITTDGQSASLSRCQAPIWDPCPIFLPLSLIIFRQLWVC
jgi:hypothetical protein